MVPRPVCEVPYETESRVAGVHQQEERSYGLQTPDRWVGYIEEVVHTSQKLMQCLSEPPDIRELINSMHPIRGQNDP